MVNSQLLTRQAALDVIWDAFFTIAPDADLDALHPGDNIWDEFALDSIDFLTFAERLSDRTGHRIEGDDYDQWLPWNLPSTSSPTAGSRW